MRPWGQVQDSIQSRAQQFRALMNELESSAFNSIMYRRFDRTQKASDAHPILHTSVSGPMYPYTDIPVQAWRSLKSLNNIRAEVDTPVARTPVEDFAYYFSYKFQPVSGDLIIELVNKNCLQVEGNAQKVYRIANVIPHSYQNSLIYYKALVESVGAQYVGDL